MAGYTRQSVAQIQNGEVVEAGPLNNEFNALQSAFNSTTGHVHDGTTGNAPKINLTTSLTGVLPVVHGGFAAIHKIDATTAPNAGNDGTQGYGPGSIWVDVTNDQVYVMVDPTTATAIWRRITLSSTGDYQPLDADLTAIAAFSSTGIAVRTAADTWAQRAITGTANAIDVTNGSGAAGNPTINLSTTLTFTGKTVNGGTFAGPTITGATLTTATVSGSFTGSLTATSLNMQANKITNLGTPTDNTDATTKSYVDTAVSGASSILTTYVDDSMPIGAVIDYAGTTEPNSKWVFAYGQEVSRSTYATLFTRLGTTYGIGDGSTTFNLPDYRGRVGAGRDNMGGTSAARLNTISSTTLGAVGGAQTHTLVTGEMADHSHTFSGTTGINSVGHTHTFSGTGSTNTTGNHQHQMAFNTSGTATTVPHASGGATPTATQFTSQAGDHSHTVSVSGTTSTQSANHTHTYSGTTSSVGSDTAHNNIQPTIIINKLIKVL